MRGAVSWQDVTRGYAPENATGPRAKPVTENSQRASAATTSAPTGQSQARLRRHAVAAVSAAADGCGAAGMKVPESLGPDDWLGGLAFAELAQRFQGRAELIEDGAARV